MVPPSRVVDAAHYVGGGRRCRQPSAGRVGEEAEHILPAQPPEGFEVDAYLVANRASGRRPDLGRAGRHWHSVSLDIGVGVVPALDETGRCLVIALHALNSNREIPQTAEDLRRARDVAGRDAWTGAAAIAASLGVTDLFEAGRESGVS